jgi:hypothetical protein
MLNLSAGDGRDAAASKAASAASIDVSRPLVEDISHASQRSNPADPIRWNFSWGRALAFRLCTAQFVVWMPGRGRFGGKR